MESGFACSEMEFVHLHVDVVAVVAADVVGDRLVAHGLDELPGRPACLTRLVAVHAAQLAIAFVVA